MEMGLMSLHAIRQTQTENKGPKQLGVIFYPGGNKGLVDMCLSGETTCAVKGIKTKHRAVLFGLQSKVFARGVAAVPLDVAKEHRDEVARLRLSSCF